MPSLIFMSSLLSAFVADSLCEWKKCAALYLCECQHPNLQWRKMFHSECISSSQVMRIKTITKKKTKIKFPCLVFIRPWNHIPKWAWKSKSRCVYIAVRHRTPQLNFSLMSLLGKRTTPLFFEEGSVECEGAQTCRQHDTMLVFMPELRLVQKLPFCTTGQNVSQKCVHERLEHLQQRFNVTVWVHRCFVSSAGGRLTHHSPVGVKPGWSGQRSGHRKPFIFHIHIHMKHLSFFCNHLNWLCPFIGSDCFHCDNYRYYSNWELQHLHYTTLHLLNFVWHFTTV